MKKHNTKQENPVYTTLNNSVDLRRHILETSIDGIKVLQRYENIKEIKAKKMALLNELRKCCGDAHKELTHFKRDMPHVELKEYIKEQKPHITHHKEEHKDIHKEIEHHANKEEHREERKIIKDPLQNELEELRRRLDNINVG
ncbi:hypothetical protein J4214_02835 [Candidatus Woesearchaeota archaeon]|nr:hypothetical protein [Candidatus Woesearchaeota archaeon]